MVLLHCCLNDPTQGGSLVRDGMGGAERVRGCHAMSFKDMLSLGI